MFKVIHSADWHYRDSDHDEIEKCVDFMIGKATVERPDLNIISGDITDSENLKLDSRSAKTICRQVSELADIAPVVVVIGTPSHDGRSAEILRYVRGTYPIHVSDRPEQIFLLRGGRLATYGKGLEFADPEDLRAVITQIPTPTKQFFQAEAGIEEGDKAIGNFMTAILAAHGDMARKYACPHILNGHFQVGGAFISETQQLIGRDIEISTDQLAMAEADVICLGHIHKQQVMGRDKNIFYSGSIYRKNFGEMEDKGFYIHDIGSPSRFIQTPTRKLLTFREDFTKESRLIENSVLNPFTPGEIKDAHLKVEFKVWQDEAGKINQAELERSFLEAGAARVNISLIRIPRETVRAARVLQLTSLRDKVQEMAALRMEQPMEGTLEKADLLESTAPEELVQIVGRVN